MGGARPARGLALALLVAAAAVLVRVPALVHRGPIDDEAVYAVVANEMVDGGRPYIDAVERKPPLLFWTYEAVTRVGGKYGWRLLHAVALAWVLATAAGLFVAGRRLFGVEGGAAAALLYVIFQPWGTWHDYAWNGEVLMNLPLAWAWVIAFGPSRSRRRPVLAGAGALVAVAFLLKQPAGIAIVALGGYVLLPAYRAARGITRRDAIGQASWLGGGFTAVMLAAAAILHAQGILAEAVYWTVLDHTVPHVFLAHAAVQTVAFAIACLPLVAGAALTLGGRALPDAERQALLLFLGVSAVGTAAGGRFYSHYYIQLILPLSLAAAPLFARACRLERPTTRGAWWQRGWLAASGLAFMIAGFAGAHAEARPSDAGRFVRAHSRATDRIFVWGQSPRIYLDARRRPACRYIASFPLTGFVFGEDLPALDTRHRILPVAWPNLEADFARHPPRYIVDVRNDAAARYRIGDFPVLAAWIAAHCVVAAPVAEGVVYRCEDGASPVGDRGAAAQARTANRRSALSRSSGVSTSIHGIPPNSVAPRAPHAAS